MIDLLWLGLVVLALTTALIGRKIMAQIDELRSAIAQLGTNLGDAVARVEAKIASLGDPDPDLSADIANLQMMSSQLDDLADDSTPDVVPPPIDDPSEPTPDESVPAPDDPTPDEPSF